MNHFGKEEFQLNGPESKARGLKYWFQTFLSEIQHAVNLNFQFCFKHLSSFVLLSTSSIVYNAELIILCHLGDIKTL